MYSKVTDTIVYVGVNDHDVDLFEGQYIVPNGISYNSYVILDDKITVMDTVDKTKTSEWLENIEEVLNGNKPDYLVIQHMEPDHSASIGAFAARYPDTVIIGNRQIHEMIGNFFPEIVETRKITVENGESMITGNHTLTFVFAPMVHWPEVMVTYDSMDKVLFSADGFGKFGALDINEPWDDEARRYFIGIVGKYGEPVQKLLKVAATLDIQIICPLHGPILTENLEKYIGLYDKWSSYEPEAEGICLCYTSVYGATKEAALLMRDELLKRGAPVVEVYDLARCDIDKAVASAFKYNKLVLATTTYNGEIFPYMYTFLHYLRERNYQKRTIGLIENGSWAPQAAKCMKEQLRGLVKLKYTDTQVTIKSVLNEKSKDAICKMADELTVEYVARQVEANTVDPSSMFKIGYGLYVITSNDGDKDNGFICNTVAQVNSGSPVQVAVNVNKNNYSAENIINSGKLNICVLDETAPFEVFTQFGFQSGRDVNKFPAELTICSTRPSEVSLESVETYATTYLKNVDSVGNASVLTNISSRVTSVGSIYSAHSTNGLPYLTRYSNAYISANVLKTVDMGTHYMFICEVTESVNLSKNKTMTYDYYQNYVKPQSATKKKDSYVCTVCGYVYEGSELPKDFVCPLCKHGIDAFEKQ